MFTRFTAIVLLWSSLCVSLSGCFVLVGFEMNRTYIATELCINRDKPQLHCNGRCYLMRKLKQAQEKEQKQEHQFAKIQLHQPAATNRYIFKQYLLAAWQFSVPACIGMPVSQSDRVFHPPQEPGVLFAAA